MRWQDIYIAGTGTFLPERFPIAEAIAQDLIGEANQNLGYESILVDRSGTAAPDMAVHAGRQAVERAGIPTEEYGLHLHAHLWYQGLDWWSAANYVAARTSGSQAFSFAIDQRSLTAIGGLHLGAAYLTSGAATSALITTADRFAAPMIDRWNIQRQLIFGDGATAAALSTRGGVAKLVSTAAFGVNHMETWTRGDEPFGEAPGQQTPVPVWRRSESRMTKPEAANDWKLWTDSMVRLKDEVLAEAGIGIGDITRAAMPFQHRGDGQAEMHDMLGLTEEQTVWRELGQYTGHIGAGDPFAGINYLLENKQVVAGDHVLVYGCGVGFNFAAAVLEITDTPAW
ncbi:3-oxoacyl-[acyl-carrier-protein] synthase-3 [Kitasatospora sp. MAP12-15]|uniref:ketoacyl-ACP synthase III family protein n=1 Tax=unclassified Kitasatospora TaxID=2633591 RepID=UPI0024748177|nr:ketoacyl-ACP synthase III family protein [Kitasatospora sp. MAP12-44]MDH6110593.1 3-oxoacyl-[acyl-carrier-protein] synthase-3 [Kitasatospora sp. MAP12-44]